MSDDERESRRQVVLAAAHRLYRERGALPPVADIASAAGLAKGTVYLYFRTKEEIFVALLEDGFARMFAALEPLLDSLPRGGAAVAGAFAAGFGRLIAGSGDLLPLAALGNAILEQNLPVEPMRRFKLALANGLAASGARLEAHTGLTPPGSGETLLLRTYALTLGLWQALSYPAALRSLLQEPGLRGLDRDFGTELEGAVAALWLGHFNGT
nr:TetR family transcriptional regulator [Telluria antibiotica]